MTPTANPANRVQFHLCDLKKRFPQLEVSLEALGRGDLETIVVTTDQGQRVFTGLRAATLPAESIEGNEVGRAVAPSERARLVEQARRRLRSMSAQVRALNETLEQRVARGVAHAEQRAAQLRHLASQLTHAEQRERRRMAQLLHDHLQQYLVGARLKLGMARHRVDEPEISDLLNQVDELLKTSIEASRSLSIELSPPILYEAGLAAALEWLARQCRDKHGLNVSVKADHAAQPADETMKVALFHAVRELLFNVVKHAGVNEATVRLCRLNDEKIELAVADQGSGFDLARPRSTGSGAGLGLFSLQERLSVLGVATRIESAPGRGTRVTLEAPVSAGSAAASEADSLVRPEPPLRMTPPTPEPQGRIRVLLAEDHKIVREGLAGILSDEPDMVVVGQAEDGRAAVDMARQLNPDAIIMDVSMPRLNGIEATRIIAQAMPHIRIIGLSAHEEEDMAMSLIRAGASAFLSKGGPAQDLTAIIRACCNRTADVAK